MNRKNTNKTPSPNSLTLAFKSFAMDAPEKELDDALQTAGMDPNALAKRAEASLSSALNAVQKPALRTAKHSGVVGGFDLALHKGLSALIRLLRRKEGLTEEELADAANVDVAEIRRIEFDETYSPSPRTVYQLEEFFKLPERTLVLLSGAVKNTSSEFTEEVVRFAAHSEAIGKLNREEKKLLNSFVRFLADELKKRD